MAQQAAKKAYLSPIAFRFLAHRGLAVSASGSKLDENTALAFDRALEVGATHLETDVQASSDGVSVICHDPDLSRIAGVKRKVSDLTAAELVELPLEHGGRLMTLEQALERFSGARFNIDIKTEAAIAGTIAVIKKLKAQDRVLLSSFSEARRLSAIGQLPGVASSASAPKLLKVWFAWRFNLRRLMAIELRDLDALQLPTHRGFIRFDSEKFMREVARHGVELHYWTINDPRLARVLRARGASGIVSDRIDIMISALAE
jgi:glycerophosphoryl diester phosphodiesterase